MLLSQSDSRQDTKAFRHLIQPILVAAIQSAVHMSLNCDTRTLGPTNSAAHLELLKPFLLRNGLPAPIDFQNCILQEKWFGLP